jgi:cephalosporin hydroxylase
MSAARMTPRPVSWAADGSQDRDAQAVVRDFNDLYLREPKRTFLNTHWLGVRLIKCPLDLWVYQELLFELRPDLIVETGTGLGGSALYLASICDLIDSGRVLTIDVWEPPGPRPEHRRITYLSGSSVAPETVTRVREEIGAEDRVMVVLDSAHEMEHVLAELRAYAPLVSEGSYLVVEDTNTNASRPEATLGPLEAVHAFLSEDDRFEVDRSQEKFFMTFNPGGYLKRVPG